jgi:hypothetical protein
VSKAPPRKSLGDHNAGQAVKVAWRFGTGRHLDGKRRGDATFFAAGTHAEPHYWGRGEESKWALLAGWQRAGLRWAVIAAAIGLWRWRTQTEWVLGLAAGVLAGLGALRLIRAFNSFGHYRTKILPLHNALAPVLDMPPATRPRSWLTVPHDYGARQDAEITVYPPHGFTASDRDKEEVTRAVTAKLGIEQPEANWSGLAGSKPRITFTKSEPPPARVNFADIKTAVEAAEPHEIVMGLGKKSQVGTVSVDNDSPHAGLSMGSGDGKSTVAKNIGAQLLHHGALLMVLDYKLISHMWARGLPNVSYAGTPDEIESALVWLAAEVGRRNRVALAGADVEGAVHADVGPRILLIAEELNATQNRLKAWWHREMGEKGRSPGSEALDEVMFLGRQVRINVLQIGQRLSVKASGSGDARENLGVLIFSDPTAAAWKMLCSQHPMPPATGHLGRLQVVTRKQVREIQGAYLTGEQARAFAQSGTVGVPRPDMPCVTSIGPRTLPQIESNPRAEQAIVLGPRTGPGGAVTLREAADAGLFPSIEAARKASQRPGFPLPVGERDRAHLFDVGDLYAYRAAKARTA